MLKCVEIQIQLRTSDCCNEQIYIIKIEKKEEKLTSRINSIGEMQVKMVCHVKNTLQS